MTVLCVCVPGNTPAHAGHCFRVSFVYHPPLCSYTCIEKCSGTSRAPFSQPLGPGRFCFSLPRVKEKAVQQVLSTLLLFLMLWHRVLLHIITLACALALI